MMHTHFARGDRSPDMWVGVSDEKLSPVLVLPSQFADIWSRSSSVGPERKLALAVLEQAFRELVHYRFARRRRGQRLYLETYQWVASNDRSWPFSFVNLCDALRLDVSAIRTQILDLPLQVRRCRARIRDTRAAA